MSIKIQRAFGVACLLPIALVACSSPNESASSAENTGVAQSDLLMLDPCTTQGPDAATQPTDYGFTKNFGWGSSTDGSYAYRSGCARYLVDDYVSKINLGESYILLTGAALDLPSSSALGGTLPANPVDCGQYKLYVDFYVKKSTDTLFSKVSSSSLAGTWITDAPAHCQLYPMPNTTGLGEYQAKVPTDGTTTIYRIAVKAVLRGSAQQVQQLVEPYIEPPR